MGGPRVRHSYLLDLFQRHAPAARDGPAPRGLPEAAGWAAVLHAGSGGLRVRAAGHCGAVVVRAGGPRLRTWSGRQSVSRSPSPGPVALVSARRGPRHRDVADTAGATRNVLCPCLGSSPGCHITPELSGSLLCKYSFAFVCLLGRSVADISEYPHIRRATFSVVLLRCRG